MSNMKKLVTGLAAAVLSVSSAVGACALEWKISGYDTSVLEKESWNTYRVGVVYEQFDNNGLSTGVVVDSKTAELYGLKPYASVSFSAPAFERAWPNREYVSVYADGKDTGKVLYNGQKENLTYRDANYMWELSVPHRIFQRKQALINGSWYTDETYPVTYAGDVATVTAEYNNFYGFGYWKVDGSNITYMPDRLLPYAKNLDTGIYYENGIANNALAPNAVTDLTGRKEIEIKKSFNLIVAGPKFNFDGSVSKGNEFGAVYNAATVPAETLANYGVDELVKHVCSYDGSCALMKVEWVGGEHFFEAAKPYRYYEYLKVGDVVLDGREIQPGMNRPKVYRYVIGPDGNYATANVTSAFTTALSKSKPFQWNETVGKYEFLVDITETLYKDGRAFASYVYKEQPSNVFGQVNYTESWKNGQKVITGILEGQPLEGKAYKVAFTGDLHKDIDWGKLNFTVINAGLDYNYRNIDDIILPVID